MNSVAFISPNYTPFLLPSLFYVHSKTTTLAYRAKVWTRCQKEVPHEDDGGAAWNNPSIHPSHYEFIFFITCIKTYFIPLHGGAM